MSLELAPSLSTPREETQQQMSLIPRSPVFSAPTILNLPEATLPPPLNLDVCMSPSFARTFSLFCSSPHLLTTFLSSLEKPDLKHFLNLTDFFECTTHVFSSLRGRSLSSGCTQYVTLHFQNLAHGYAHSCIGTFLCLSQAQVFPPGTNPKNTLKNPKTLSKTFFFLIEVISSSLTELPNNVLLLLFGWKSKRPVEVLIESILYPALENPETALGFPLSPHMKVLTKSLSSLLKACRRIGAVDLDALDTAPNVGTMVDIIRSQKLQRRLENLAKSMERPTIEQELPESYVNFLELWEDNHHPCELNGPLMCEVNLATPLSLSLSSFQKLLREGQVDVAKRLHSRAVRGKIPMAEAESAQQVMQALSSC